MMSRNGQIGHRQLLVIQLLHSRGWVKGTEITEALGIPQTEIWNVINRIRMRGVVIHSDVRGQHSKGYLLDRDQDVTPFLPVADAWLDPAKRIIAEANGLSDHDIEIAQNVARGIGVAIRALTERSGK